MPQQLYEMELWELNLCIAAYNSKTEQEHEGKLYFAWQTASFSGAAFGGKLKKFDHYRSKAASVQGRELTFQEMDAIDKRIKERRGEDGIK